MIRILVADDHAVVRRGVRQILSEEPDMLVVAEAANAVEVLEQLRAHPCDVLILDVGMPGRSGLDLLPDLKHAHPHLRVLVLSMYGEDQFALRVLRAGAAGYLTKESAPDELVRAVRKLHSGARYISPSLAESLATAMLDSSDRPLHETLSGREFEVMRLIASGKSVSEIGAELSLSVKTVSTYRSRILEKLGIPSNAALIRYALAHGLVD